MVAKTLVELGARAEGAGALAGADVRRGRAEHAVCGDVVEWTLRLGVDGSVAELGWLASGCPVVVPVTACAWHALRGADSPDDAAERLGRELARHGGLRPHERHVERLVLRAFAEAFAAPAGAAP